MDRHGIGQPVRRDEDPRLLRGQGRYLADLDLPGQAWVAFVRSPHAHARIVAIDAADARAAPGVLGIFTAADLDGLAPTRVTLKRARPDGAPMFWHANAGLAEGRARHVGDPVAMVVAETPAQAADAAERVAVDYEMLPSVTDGEAAEGGAPVWDECADNVCCTFEVGDAAATEAAFARAARVVKRRYAINRVHAQFMEPRGALAAHDAGTGLTTLWNDTQYPHKLREVVAAALGVPEHALRVIAPDVGGAFGAKGWSHPEQRLVPWLARRLGRPVKWLCERSESPLADEHARDCVNECELALDADHRFLALRVRARHNLGAYVATDRPLLPGSSNLGSMVGMYAFGAAHVRVTSLYSNTSPVAPYRGNGRPEAIYVIERLIDDAARALGVDRVTLRRRNLVPPQAMPYRTALTFTFDCGEFEAVMDQALSQADAAGFEARRAASAHRGRLRGLGIANAIERAASPPSLEFAEVRFDPGGTATLFLGTASQGQGHETMFRQIACTRLGLAPQAVRVVEGDTGAVAYGAGTFGSRSAALGGTALWLAADKVIAKGRLIAAHLLESGEADLEFVEGRYRIAGTDRSVALDEVARASWLPARLPRGIAPGLVESATFTPAAETFPNGCHVCEVEIDPETGAVSLERYHVVDDVGTEINPLTLKGQVMGGVVQGLGQALMERMIYDPESGQLLTGSFMDYALPRADDVCALEIGGHPVPTALNPLGAKGAGEAGTVGALAAVMNAVADALAARGAEAPDMPASAERVWRALAAGGAAGSSAGVR